MKIAMTKTYRQNRARFPASDLKRYGSQWVAFSADAPYLSCLPGATAGPGRLVRISTNSWSQPPSFTIFNGV